MFIKLAENIFPQKTRFLQSKLTEKALAPMIDLFLNYTKFNIFLYITLF